MPNFTPEQLLGTPETTVNDLGAEVPAEQPKGRDPYEMVAALGGPSKDSLDSIKSQVPNGRLRIFSPDMDKRVYILRGLTGLEWADCRKRVPQNSSDAEGDFHINVVAKGCVWTSASRDGKLNDTGLRTGTAGMPSTLFQMVAFLSDFVSPEAFGELSAEL